MRDSVPIVPSGDDQMLPDDEVYFVVDTKHLPRAMVAFGHEETEARRLLIFGAGNIGLLLAQQLRERISMGSRQINRKGPRACQDLPQASWKKTIVLEW